MTTEEKTTAKTFSRVEESRNAASPCPQSKSGWIDTSTFCYSESLNPSSTKLVRHQSPQSGHSGDFSGIFCRCISRWFYGSFFCFSIKKPYFSSIKGQKFPFHLFLVLICSFLILFFKNYKLCIPKTFGFKTQSFKPYF
jgi:hypothetical protein